MKMVVDVFFGLCILISESDGESMEGRHLSSNLLNTTLLTLSFLELIVIAIFVILFGGFVLNKPQTMVMAVLFVVFLCSVNWWLFVKHINVDSLFAEYSLREFCGNVSRAKRRAIQLLVAIFLFFWLVVLFKIFSM